MDQDCGFQKGETWFYYRVAAFIIEEQCLLMAWDPQKAMYVPLGGGVHLHESGTDALRRQVYEETGIHYEVKRLAEVHEHFYEGKTASLTGLTCHEMTLYYLMKSKGKRFWLDPMTSQERHLSLEWLKLEKIHQYPLDPSFPLAWFDRMPREVQYQVFDERDSK
ncbi:MAG TPA: NUDIX domain-containing protein [Candidatus Fimiplasma intestinipullorum]|uniref:NUDIX domain-containing protein n=1 Tax=Candidatus Fimiplasma intestinipullorum TaxID=2840825 RepID=A0A9D1HNJ4_9FIRM|nr:NUDIX domain-containing protein [Candidatus Fimiplasma intestinipullorum]